MTMKMKSLQEILQNQSSKPENTPSRLPIRPLKKKTRFYIDNEYFAKGYGELFHRSRVFDVYGVLAKYANHRTQICWPAIKTIMKEAGIRNRNTVIKAVKLLESYNIISISHSRGHHSNRYTLLSSYVWRPANSITGDTVPDLVTSVPDNSHVHIQNEAPNSISSDTENHISKSNKEISVTTFMILEVYFKSSDIEKAVETLKNSGLEINFITVKRRLQLWSKEKTIIPIKELEW